MQKRPPASFRQIVELWGSPDTLADEIGAPISAARKWYWRDAIPSKWWFSIIKHKRARDAGVTAELLTRIDAR